MEGEPTWYDVQKFEESIKGLSANMYAAASSLETAMYKLVNSSSDLTQALRELQNPPQTPTEPSLLDAPVKAFAFERAVLTCFERNGIRYLRDLCERSEDNLHNIRGLGDERIGRIKALLNELDLHLAP